MSEPNDPLKIMGWGLTVTWTDGTVEDLIEIPNDVAQTIDDYLTDLETEKAHDHAMKYGGMNESNIQE